MVLGLYQLAGLTFSAEMLVLVEESGTWPEHLTIECAPCCVQIVGYFPAVWRIRTFWPVS